MPENLREIPLPSVKQRILIIDDEPSIIGYLKDLLSHYRYQVSTAATGSDGLEKALRDPPDLVLLDVMIPDKNGFEVCRALKQSEKTKNVPILLLTVLQDTRDKITGLDAGADDFISKPFKDGEVLARVRAFLRTKQLHDELEKNYVKLRQMDELKDSLTEMIVHDLKLPLTMVQGNACLMAELLESKDKKMPPDMRIFLASLQKGCDRILTLINDLIDVSRLEQNKFPIQKTLTDPADLAESVLNNLRAIRQDRKIIFKKSDRVPQVLMDIKVIERVLGNLLSNSIKFTKSDGKIVVSVKPVPKEREVELSVEDSGLGIPKKYLDKVFDKFFQVDGHEAVRKGQGLGLTFCRLAVEAHGGKIWAKSGGSKGSNFIVRLPIA